MADDLADRISDGAMAVTDLVPDEQRFARLSNFVLRGGASRFAPVVLDDEPIRYVLPVGVPGLRLDFGTLLIQTTQCALVWRTDPARPYQALVTHLGPDTSVMQSAATVQGEIWGRFDLHHTGSANVTFLVPPVTAPALPRMLQRVLVTEPGSMVGHFDLSPLPASVSEVAPAAAPDLPVLPVPDPEPAPQLAALDTAPEAITPVQEHPEQSGPLYRESDRVTPEPAEPEGPFFRPISRSPAPPAPPEPVTALLPAVPALPTPTPLPTQVSAVQRRGMAPLRAFLIGLGATLAVGAVLLLAKALGWIG